MTVLKLRIDTYLEQPGSEEFKAVANIRPLPDAEGKWQEGRQTLYNITIPVGSGSPMPGYKEIELAPGRYLIEAVLPSGEKLQDEIDIRADIPLTVFHLQGEKTPHEWLSKQYLYGTVQRRDLYEKTRNAFDNKTRSMLKPLARRSFNQLDYVPKRLANYQDFFVESSLNDNGSLPGCFFLYPKELKKLAKNPMKVVLPDIGSIRTADQIPFNLSPSDSLSQLYRINSQLLAQIGYQPGHGGGDFQYSHFKRYFIIVKRPDVKLQYAVIPSPWMVSNWSSEAMIEAIVQLHGNNSQKDMGFDEKFRLRVNVNDVTVGPMISYLGKGKLDSAKSILLAAREKLKEKMVNPFAAAAGAYIMLTDWYSGESSFFHDWVGNLMGTFPWMPDGAILYASLLLKRKRSKETLRMAREALLEGYKRGLPYYSRGVGLLLDGLTLFCNEAKESKKEDQKVDEALKIAQKMALRTDFKQPFTTIMLE